MMKMMTVCLLILVCAFTVCSCSAPEPAAEPTPGLTPELTPATTPEPIETATPEPTASPTPAPTVFGEAPDRAGTGDVMFDIYQRTALVDLDQNGQPEQLTFSAGEGTSTLQINETVLTIDKEGLAQQFAVTDVDGTDHILELAFTDKYADLADSEKAFTWLYWWDGTQIIRMGGLMDVKFDGAWRASFDPTRHFDGQGMVMCLTNSNEFSDVWYTGHYVCDGADRKLKEDSYVATPINQQEELTVKQLCVLLKHKDSKYFKPEYAVMWDFASSGGLYERDYMNDDIAFVPHSPETLKIVSVYGKRWFKLEAEDGKAGWLKCVDGQVQGYWQVMQYTASDLFDGLINAG